MAFAEDRLGFEGGGMSRQLLRRTTAMTEAFVAACEGVGIDTENVRLPSKVEPTWTVTRRQKK